MIETGDDLAVFWHHGTPNIGSPPEPLSPADSHISVLNHAEAALEWLTRVGR